MKALSLLLICLSLLMGCAREERTASDEAYLTSGFWEKHLLDNLAPYWLEHSIDNSGGYFSGLDRDWKPEPQEKRLLAMQSRHVFGFSLAFQLSGDVRYLKAASHGVDFILESGWDTEFGGWFNAVDTTGRVLDMRKSVPLELYTNVGLLQYFMATREESVLKLINRSIALRREHALDPLHGGYFAVLDRSLGPLNLQKNKHAHYGFTGSLLLNHFLATDSAGIQEYGCELMDLSLKFQRDEAGWIYGLRNKFTRDWKRISRDEPRRISVGSQMTMSLALLRLYEQTGESSYMTEGLSLVNRINTFAWDEKGRWLDWILDLPGYPELENSSTAFWVQAYGMILQLHAYRITGSAEYLSRFKKAASFYHESFYDAPKGGVFGSVGTDGIPSDTRKSYHWHTPYHQVELAFLCHAMIALYVENSIVTLNYQVEVPEGGRTFYFKIVDDPAVRIQSMEGIAEQDLAIEVTSATVEISTPGIYNLKVAYGLWNKKTQQK